ncbi:hypothetical protein D4740_12670 [Actinomyces sp. 2119]|nr:hypothetical protein D4740_12670 [Actinomyces sp. 2119]
MVLQVNLEELGTARSLAGQSAASLEGVHPEEGSQAVFGQAVLTGAAQAFAWECRQAARRGGQRADSLVEGLSWSMNAYEETDQEAAQGARAIGGTIDSGSGWGAWR